MASLALPLWVLVGISAIAAVFVIILILRLLRVSTEAERTLTIINSELPGTLARINTVADRADATLRDLDISLERVRGYAHRAGIVAGIGQRLPTLLLPFLPKIIRYVFSLFHRGRK